MKKRYRVELEDKSGHKVYFDTVEVEDEFEACALAYKFAESDKRMCKKTYIVNGAIEILLGDLDV